MVRGFKIGFMPRGSYMEWPIEKICKDLREIGYDAVEWSTDILNPQILTPDEIKNVVDVSESLGLDVSEVVVQRDLVTPDEEERSANIDYTLECIRVYGQAGIKTINLFTGPRPWIDEPVKIGKEIGEGQGWNMVLQAFDRFVPEAEKYGVNLAVEGVWGMLAHDFYTTWYLINHYDSPALGVNFDPSHDILCDNKDVGWIIRQWGKDRIKHVHLKDAVGIMEDGRFVFPLLGEGKVDWKAFLATMDDIDYSGTMSVEFESFDYLGNILKGNMHEAARISMDNIRTLFGV